MYLSRNNSIILKQQSQTRERIEIPPQKFGQILIFWLVVVVIPLLTGKIISILYLENIFSQELRIQEARIADDLQHFSQALHIETYLEHHLQSIDHEMQAWLLRAGKKRSLEKILSWWQDKFKQKFGFQPLIAFTASNKNEFFAAHDPTMIEKWGGYLGKAAARIIVKGLFRQAKKGGDPSEEIFWQLLKSVFGSDFSREIKNNCLNSTFSTRLGGRRLFLYYCLFDGDEHASSARAGLVFAFTEDQVRQTDHLKWAGDYLMPPGFSRKIVAKSAGFSLGNQFADGILAGYLPVPIRALRISSHVGNSLLQKGIENGFFLKKPAEYLFLKVTADMRPQLKKLNLIKFLVSFTILLLAFISLHSLRLYAIQGRIHLNIRSKLFLGIFLATVLPALGFFILASRYFDFYQSLNFSLSLDSAKQHLQLLELRMRNHEQLRQHQFVSFVQELRRISGAGRQKLEKKLDSHLNRLYHGCFLARSDGLIIDKRPLEKALKSRDKQKLKMLTDLFKAQSLRVFKARKILFGDYFDKLSSTPHGRQLMAMGDLFSPPDLDNFCLQDGDYHKTEKDQKDIYLFSTFNLIPGPRDAGKDEKWAFVGFIQDVGKITEEFLRQHAAQSDFLVKREGKMLLNTAIFRIHPEKNGNFRIGETWPKNFAHDPEMLLAADRLNQGKEQDSWISWQKIPIIYAVRKLDKVPFIAVVQGVVDLSHAGSLPLILSILAIYLLTLITIISLVNSSLFLKPMNALLEATALVNEGDYRQIAYQDSHELGELVSRFNRMSVGLIERQRLERFVSSEAARTIEDEILHQREHEGERTEVAVAFVHVREFEKYCEQLAPDDLIALLNSYFAAMEPVIQRNLGVIDKYIGDAIMVVFSCPQQPGDAVQNACTAAIEMLQRQSELGCELERAKLPRIGLGIGVARGEVIRGKIGAESGRKDFTVIGDVVNLAARLESLSRQCSEPTIIVSARVLEDCKDSFTFEKFGEIAIKGKAKKQHVYRLCGRRR